MKIEYLLMNEKETCGYIAKKDDPYLYISLKGADSIEEALKRFLPEYKHSVIGNDAYFTNNSKEPSNIRLKETDEGKELRVYGENQMEFTEKFLSSQKLYPAPSDTWKAGNLANLEFICGLFPSGTSPEENPFLYKQPACALPDANDDLRVCMELMNIGKLKGKMYFQVYNAHPARIGFIPRAGMAGIISPGEFNDQRIRRWCIGCSLHELQHFNNSDTEENLLKTLENRALSNIVLAAYCKLEGKDWNPGHTLKDGINQPHHIPTLNVLAKVWEKHPKHKREAVKRVWEENFNSKDVEKALKFIEGLAF